MRNGPFTTYSVDAYLAENKGANDCLHDNTNMDLVINHNW